MDFHKVNINENEFEALDVNDNSIHKGHFAKTNKGVWIFEKGKTFFFQSQSSASRKAQSQKGAEGDYSIESPMPAKVFKILKSNGDEVKKGDVILILEAMKMEHPILSPHDGKVSELDVKEADMVQAGQILGVVSL